jgi:hypothetical protein
MGYRSKQREQAEARRLRALSWTLADIATHLNVSKSSVSIWVRDVEFVPSPRRRGAQRRPHPAHDRKLQEIEECDRLGRDCLGDLSDQAFLAAGVALYAGEGSKTDGKIVFANTDPTMVAFFCAWFRRFFEVDEGRLRVRVYLHEGLDLAAAQSFWSSLTRVPQSQFGKSYRAKNDPSIRRNKHEMGCAYVCYSSSRVHRQIMGLIRALLSFDLLSGVAQQAAQLIVNQTVAGSSPAPGAQLKLITADATASAVSRNA